MPHNLLARALLIFGIGLALLAVGFAGWFYLQPGAMQEARFDPNASGGGDYGGPFTLTNQNGDRVSRSDFAGSYLLIYFGYTFCPDVCPTSLSVMTQALDRLEEEAPEKAAAVQPLFITVDPERDSVEVLKQYVEFFHPRLIGLTGTLDEIDQVAKDYRIYVKKVRDESATDYLVDHSSTLILLGRDGEFIRLFSHGTPPQEIATALSSIVKR